MTISRRRGGQLDGEWKAASMCAQWLTGVIADDAMTSRIGVAPILSRRWSNTAVDVTVDQVENALVELIARGWVVIDDNEDLVWLRTYMLDHDLFSQPNKVRGALKLIDECPSQPIRLAACRLIDEHARGSAGLTIGRRNRADIASAVRLAVYHRDDWTCQVCARHIPPTESSHLTGEQAPYDETGWLALDHIYPWSLDGADDESNLQALCTPCNASKGARVAEPH